MEQSLLQCSLKACSMNSPVERSYWTILLNWLAESFCLLAVEIPSFECIWIWFAKQFPLLETFSAKKRTFRSKSRWEFLHWILSLSSFIQLSLYLHWVLPLGSLTELCVPTHARQSHQRISPDDFLPDLVAIVVLDLQCVFCFYFRLERLSERELLVLATSHCHRIGSTDPRHFYRFSATGRLYCDFLWQREKERLIVSILRVSVGLLKDLLIIQIMDLCISIVLHCPSTARSF